MLASARLIAKAMPPPPGIWTAVGVSLPGGPKVLPAGTLVRGVRSRDRVD